jgi:fatty acid desaturase
MIKSLVVAAALTIGLAGYAFAQETVTGAPAGTASVNAEPPMMHMHHHMHHHHHHHMHHDMAAPMAAPAEAPK